MFLNGTGRHAVMSADRISTLGIMGNFLYWIDSVATTVLRAGKVIGADPVVLGSVGYQVTNLQVFAEERQNCKFNKLMSA